MGKNFSNVNKCKRCRKPTDEEIICQSCKNELLANYEASSDWLTAFEIEKAQLTASRYRSMHEEDDDYNY